MNYSRPFSSRSGRRRRGGAFTLVELMISIALALLLIYGVSQVFKMSGDTVGAQQAVSANVRDQRAVGATVTEDWRNSLPDSPLTLISSRIAYGYDNTAKSGFRAGWKNAEEERNGDPSGDPTKQEVNGSTFVVPITRGSDRTPRLDRLGFFARNIYRSQTASDTQVSSGVAGAEAYIWYGHVALYDPKTNNAIQPQEQYASDRVLGRMAILMKNGPGVPPLGAKFLLPLGYANNLYKSMQDYAQPNLAESIEQWRQTANFAYNNGNSATPGAAAFAWYLPMLDPGPGQYWRAWCTPTVYRPVTQTNLSMTVPYFVGNCTQFIVEYAGDFVDQDEFDTNVPGRVVDVKKKRKLASAGMAEEIETDTAQHRLMDGDQIDYIIDTSGDPANPPNDPSKWVKKVRWYGLPRDTNGDGAITINDVVPLADVLAYYDGVTPAPTSGIAVAIKTSDNKLPWAPWEVEVPNPGLAGIGNDYRNFPASAANAFRYTCAWHNDGPAMIRITMKVDDPTGRIKDGQWFQYVLSR
jgi:type II secretory pathway pseudopilin PulG